MKKLKFVVLLWLFGTPAFGQGVPAEAQPPVSVPFDLINRIFVFLGNGGTYSEAAGLRDALVQNAQAGQREALVQRRIDEAVAAAKAAAK